MAFNFASFIKYCEDLNYWVEKEKVSLENTREYLLDGKLHRIDGPAFISNYGELGSLIAWYDDGMLHRENDDQPTSINTTGAKWLLTLYWYRHNYMHRLKGPALIQGS